MFAPPWADEIQQAFERAVAETPAITTPVPLLPKLQWDWEAELKEAWSAARRSYALPQSSPPQAVPLEWGWSKELEELFARASAETPQVQVQLPQPQPFKFEWAREVEERWAAFMRFLLLGLPVPPANLQAVWRATREHDKTRFAAWSRSIASSYKRAIAPLPEPSKPEMKRPVRFQRPAWNGELREAVERALARPAVAKAMKLHEPEPRFADLPAWKQELWRSWWTFKREINKPAEIFVPPQPLSFALAAPWEQDLERAYRLAIGPAVEQIESPPSIDTEPAPRPLGFEKQLRAVLEDPRSGLAKRRASHTAPTHRWKKSRPSPKTGKGWMHVARQVIDRVETADKIERHTQWWDGKTVRRWVPQKVYHYKWSHQRIRPSVREDWEERAERFESRAGLQADEKLRRPKWLEEEEWLYRLERTEYAELNAAFLAAETRRIEPAGNPDLRRKGI